jgi:hypothetical protein
MRPGEQIEMVDVCSDQELGYERGRTWFSAGAGLALDETYCLAHLPLVAPDHPRVIPTRDGTTYQMGRHARIFSLVLPVPGEALRKSKAYQDLDRELRAAPFSNKIAWQLLEQRQDKLHATVCGSLSTSKPPNIDEVARGQLASLGPVAVEVRGLFSGNVNRGRLYLRVYPERRHGSNVFHLIQRALNRPQTDLYVVGVYNLIDDLDAQEAAVLNGMIERWWDRAILRFETDHLWLLSAMDDLVLDSAVTEVVSLIPHISN